MSGSLANLEEKKSDKFAASLGRDYVCSAQTAVMSKRLVVVLLSDLERSLVDLMEALRERAYL